MATAVYINVYSSHLDRGATVSSTPREHYEVDEKQIMVGKPLPQWPVAGGAPVVKAYDGNQLTLERLGKTFVLRAGDEQEIDGSEHAVGMGVISRTYCCVKLVSAELLYKGSWQQGSTILQKLEGPIGEGEVFYPNGDHFKGYFHLSYAHINGSAYAAEGRYEFADGSYIEDAWIHTSDDNDPMHWGLHGVFRIHHPKGGDSIAMFLHGGRRYGFELFLPDASWEKPRVREWYGGGSVVRYCGPGELFQYEVVDYQVDETGKSGFTTLRLTLRDGEDVYRVEQYGGKYEKNNYDNSIYEPSTRVILHLPNGDSLDHYGDDVREMKPFDGYVDVHCAKTGKWRTERWENGVLADDQEWKYDVRAAKETTLPEPTGVESQMKALVWADGHIEYNDKEWTYDGEVKYGRPDGQGVLQGDSYHGNRRYEGEFANGVYVSTEEQYDGEITLHVKSGENGSYEEYDIVAKRGRLNIRGFWNYEITSVKADSITIEFYEEKYVVRPGEPLHLYNEIEGREWSDGCVYDSDEYTLDITWKE